MAEIEIKVKGYKCERCGYRWIPRIKNKVPEICPKCKSASWHKPRKTKNS